MNPATTTGKRIEKKESKTRKETIEREEDKSGAIRTRKKLNYSNKCISYIFE